MMSKRKNTKQALLSSALALVLCISMLIGSTFAWFTDSVTSAGNIIKSGNLKIDMQWAETYNGENTVWNDAEGANSKPVFDYDNWEPGYTVVRYIKVSNEGNLAFKYLMNIIPTGVVGKLAEVIDVQYDIVTNNNSFAAPTADNKNGSLSTIGTLDQVLDNSKTVVSGVLLPEKEEKAGFYSGEIVVCISLHMQESAGNEYQEQSIGDSFNIQLLATQYTYESDSFGNLYDRLADYSIYVTQSKKLEPGADAVDFSIAHKDTVIAKLSVPAGAIADISKPITVTVDGINPSETIVVGENNKSFAYDIDVTNLKDDLSSEQLITVVLTAPNALPAVKTYHKGALIDSAVYDEVAGTITFKTASFSPYVVLWKERTASTAEELRACITGDDDVYITLNKDITFNFNEGTDGFNGDEKHMAKSTAQNYAYYNGVNISGKNVAIDLNGHDITASGNVGAVFFVLPDSSLNITDSVGNGKITAKDPCYIVWAPYDDPSFCDIYGGIFVTDTYAGVTNSSEHTGAIVYAGEGGTINIYGGYYLYNNTPDDAKNTNNGAFNVMDGNIYNENPCITIHDGVMLINEHYRQSTGTDNETVKLASYCTVAPVTLKTPVAGYTQWYQVQNTSPSFETVFENTDKYTYRIGNINDVALGSLFKTNSAVSSGAIIDVTVAPLNNSGVQGTYTAASDITNWAKGTIKFTGTGLAKITINNKYELTVEIINAKNATSAMSATENDVVLLNDMSFSTFTVSGGHTLHGNGFTLSSPNDITGDSMSAAYITLDNGTLDNVEVICPDFSLQIMYDSQAKVSGNVDPNAEWRFKNYRSAVTMNGNSRISNSRISGGRAAVYVRSGFATLENSMLQGGAIANIHVSAAQHLTLRDMNLVQRPTKATVNDTSKVLMGFSVVFVCSEDGSSTPLTLEGTLDQFAWANESYMNYVPDGAAQIVETVLKQNYYKHNFALNGGEKDDWLNLGFAYMPAGLGNSVSKPTINDNRTDKDSRPYDFVGDIGALGTTTYVYSYKNTKGTDENLTAEPGYTAPDAGIVLLPELSFEDTKDGITFLTVFDEQKGWTSTLEVDLDSVGSYSFSFDDLIAAKNGQALNYTVKSSDGSSIDKSQTITLSGSNVTEYTLFVTDIDGKTIHEMPFVLIAKMSKINPPEKVAEVGGTPLLVVKSKNSDWSCALPALEGTQIKYWSVADKTYKTLTLSDLTPTSTGKINGTNNYWTYSASNDDYTLTVTCGVIHEGKGVYGMPVVVNNGENKMYFTISSTTGYVSTSTSARAVTVSYEFKDNNGGVLTFDKTWQFNYADYKDEAQYSYNDFVNGKMTNLLESSCVVPDTLITLADGTQKRVDALTGDELLLVWNLETGKYDFAPIVFVDSETETEYEIIHLYFSDGSDVKVISEHGFFDLDLGKYVYIDAANYADYIGHRFVTQGDIESNNWNEVTLDKVILETEVTTAWSPVTFEHLCYYTNGVLSMPGGIDGLFNIFEVDTDTMTYDAEQMQKDIESYGLFTYEDFGELIPEIAFEAFNGDYLKVAIGKGLLTWEDIAYLAERYMPLM